jgi:Protein of unknown function (DUF4236)
MRFHRSIKLLPGIRLNLSKSGFGVSAGVRGLRVGIDAKGRSYVNAGIPGTGLSVRQYGKKAAVSSETAPVSRDLAMDEHAERDRIGAKIVWPLLGAAALIFTGILWVSQHGENAPAPPALTPEQNAIQIAEKELARSHPEFMSTRITQDGPFPATQTADGYGVQLRYLRGAGDVTSFLCSVHGITAVCTAPPPPTVVRKKARRRRRIAG